MECIGSLWVIEKGPEAGNRVIVEGLQRVQPGSRCNTQSSQSPSESWRQLLRHGSWEESQHDERKTPELDALALRETLRQRLQVIEGGRLVPFNPPPIQGLGNAGGFNMKVQDRAGKDVASLAEAADLVVAAARQRKELAGVITTFSANEPQVWLDVDRDRTMIRGVPISDVFTALQTYLGSLYVNDFNLYGRTFRVLRGCLKSLSDMTLSGILAAGSP